MAGLVTDRHHQHGGTNEHPVDRSRLVEPVSAHRGTARGSGRPGVWLSILLRWSARIRWPEQLRWPAGLRRPAGLRWPAGLRRSARIRWPARIRRSTRLRRSTRIRRPARIRRPTRLRRTASIRWPAGLCLAARRLRLQREHQPVGMGSQARHHPPAPAHDR